VPDSGQRQDVGGSAHGRRRALSVSRTEISKFHITRYQFAELQIELTFTKCSNMVLLTERAHGAVVTNDGYFPCEPTVAFALSPFPKCTIMTCLLRPVSANLFDR